jgi:hypothetical protein
VCYELFSTPSFFSLLLSIDQDVASAARQAGCQCGGALHRAAYPRKPRGIPAEARDGFISRLSFCCAACRKRATPASVRFLGRRVYLGLVLALVSQRSPSPRAIHPLLQALSIPRRTLERWREWWRKDFRLTPLWQLGRAWFLPPVVERELPDSLRHRFETADPGDRLAQVLLFLSPLSTRVLSNVTEVR